MTVCLLGTESSLFGSGSVLNRLTTGREGGGGVEQNLLPACCPLEQNSSAVKPTHYTGGDTFGDASLDLENLNQMLSGCGSSMEFKVEKTIINLFFTIFEVKLL